MVILSQIRSVTSSPDLGVARAFAILYMGVVSVSFTRSPVCVCVCVCVCGVYSDVCVGGGYIVMCVCVGGGYIVMSVCVCGGGGVYCDVNCMENACYSYRISGFYLKPD